MIHYVIVIGLLFLTVGPSPRSADAAEGTAGGDKTTEDSRREEAEELRRLSELFLRNQAVFIRKGELMVELNTFYNRNNRVEFIPGTLLMAQTTRRFIDTTAILRYGLLTDGLELDIIAPVFVHSEVVSEVGDTRTRRVEDGVGDILAALRYEAWVERGLRPAIIFDVDVKSRTGGTGLLGTGTWAAGGGVTFVKTIDPVVFFGRLGYIYNFTSKSRDLGDVVDYRIGMGFSLNYQVSFNIQLLGSYIGASRFDGIAVAAPVAGPGTLILTTRNVEIMNLVFTSTIAVTRNFFLEPLVGIGLTENSFTIIGVRVPYRF